MNAKLGSVLCVDDEPNILRSLQWLLHKDFDVTTAPSGPAALELMRKREFDVIVTDQRMPEMIGSQLLSEACRLAPRTMRILLTGYSDMQAILSSINEGEVFRFVNKPWSNVDLLKTVAHAAEIARTLPPPQAAPAVEAAPDLTGETILVIDDDHAMLEVVRSSVPGQARLKHVSSLADAVTLLGTEPVAVICSEARVGQMEAAPLLKLLKREHPEIVSVVLANDTDVNAVIGLINQGQIYRFAPKPVGATFLRILLASAIRKHLELKSAPDAARRHTVEMAPADAEQKLMEDLRRERERVPASARPTAAPSMFSRLGTGLRRLFGTA